MSIALQEWNVVIVGSWNRAILTPAGISKRLFDLGDDTAVEVLVALDIVAPFRVKHEGIIVTASSERLDIELAENSYVGMGKAMQVGRTALGNLPETPVSAAGFNFRFQAPKSTAALARAVGHPLDAYFSDADRQVTSRAISRWIDWRDGEIRFTINEGAGDSYSILINFHKNSASPKVLGEWLNIPIDDARSEVEAFLFDGLGIDKGDINYGETK